RHPCTRSGTPLRDCGRGVPCNLGKQRDLRVGIEEDRKQVTLSTNEMNEVCVNTEHQFITPAEHTKVIGKTT
ncbi:unnamed protein product, partial [Bubo scandiacus]